MSTLNPLGNVLLGAGTNMTPDQAATQQSVQQGAQPLTAPTGQSMDPLAAQADALSRQIAEMLIPRRPGVLQQINRASVGAGIGAMTPPGQNPANALNQMQALEQQRQQEAIQNRLALLAQIRQQQYQRGELGVRQQEAQTRLAGEQSLAGYREKEAANVAQRNKNALTKAGIQVDDEGNPQVDEQGQVKLTPQGQANLDKTRADAELKIYTQELRRAQTEMELAKNDPSSPAYKLAKDRYDVMLKNAQTAAGRLGLGEQEFRAKYLGQGPTGEDLPGVARDEQGQAIGPSVMAAGKAPAQLTVQSAAADRTKQMTSVVRQIVKEKPYLIGPAMGRINQAGQYIGGTPLQNGDDERDAALLAGHLAYLFANEIQGTMTGRPNPVIVQKLQAASAQMKDDPQILEGFLRSADNNADIALKTGAQYGVRKLGQAPPKTAAPAPGGERVKVKGPKGETGTMPKGAKLPAGWSVVGG